MSSEADAAPVPHKNEGIKEGSDYLRGTILEGLADASSGGISGADQQLTKFHGTYQQDDRDVRTERRKAKLERAFQFMVRIGIPGGICTPAQWRVMDDLADRYANGTLRLTTRQAFQLHGVLKGDLRATIRSINEALMTTLSACGDVNRNVMCSPNPERSAVHGEVYRLACAVSDHLKPRTPAYREIWVDGERVDDSGDGAGPAGNGGAGAEVEPIYGPTYLPRKFKIGFVVPPDNDVDVFSQDLGFIAVEEGGRLAGFNVTVGGGMGMDHNKPATYPRLGDVIGFARPGDVVAVAEAVVTAQRDFGDRSNRKHARLKYTIDDRGVDWFKGEVERRSGLALGEARPFAFDTTADRYGWNRGADGSWNFTLFVLSGRVKDDPGDPGPAARMKSGLRALAEEHKGDFRLTPNQNIIIGKVAEEDRPRVEAILEEYGLGGCNRQSGLRLNALSCVALPTCGLAIAESERSLPGLVEALEAVAAEAGLGDEAIGLRVTGCPNGCARPYLGEIGLAGSAPGKYDVYLGAALDGTRLNKRFMERATIPEVIEEVGGLIRRFGAERDGGERFGDFVIRAGVVAETTHGTNFHR